MECADVRRLQRLYAGYMEGNNILTYYGNVDPLISSLFSFHLNWPRFLFCLKQRRTETLRHTNRPRIWGARNKRKDTNFSVQTRVKCFRQCWKFNSIYALITRLSQQFGSNLSRRVIRRRARLQKNRVFFFSRNRKRGYPGAREPHKYVSSQSHSTFMHSRQTFCLKTARIHVTDQRKIMSRNPCDTIIF